MALLSTVSHMLLQATALGTLGTLGTTLATTMAILDQPHTPRCTITTAAPPTTATLAPTAMTPATTTVRPTAMPH